MIAVGIDISAKVDAEMAAMAGLDPRQFTSGSSIHRQTRISKAGNRFLRIALFMPTLSATRVARALRQRRSVNPVAAAGQGGGRLLRDLAGFGDNGSDGDGNGDALWLYADLKQHRYDYRALVALPWGQTGLDGNPPTMRDLSSVQSLEPRFWP